MKHSDEAEVTRTDLATFLIQLSLRLSVGAMALEGLARREGRPGEPQHDEIAEVGASLERIAEYLKTATEHLCPACRMADVEERVSFKPPARAKRVYRISRVVRRAAEPGQVCWETPLVKEPAPVASMASQAGPARPAPALPAPAAA